jgi:hypothetical protein
MWRQIGLWIEWMAAWWCKRMHASVRWPIHGRYECATCGRRYRVPWHQAESSRSRAAAAGLRQPEARAVTAEASRQSDFGARPTSPACA